MPRKYTKHDYFKDLEKKMAAWVSVQQQKELVRKYINQVTHSSLQTTQKEVMDLLILVVIKISM